MPRAKTPTFVLELPLVVSQSDERIILSRLEAGRRLYNAVLHEALKRLNAMRSSEDWNVARSLPAGKYRSESIGSICKNFGFTEFALHSFVKIVRKAAGWDNRLSAQETQTLATRVFQTVREYVFGGRGKPRFKSVNRPLHSLEGKQNTTGIRFLKELGVVQWTGLILPARVKDTEYFTEALKNKTKYCRIVWKNLNGRKRFYVQLMQEGLAPNGKKYIATDNSVGLDIGPSNVAIVSENVAALEMLAPNIIQPWKETKRLQRKLDRSRRAMNPQNYTTNGTIRRGVKLNWKASSRYKRTVVALATTERKLASGRKRDHGELVNKILAQGNVVKTEALSYKGFQKNFGRSAKVRASGLFYSILTRKAESAGGKVENLNTRALAMSQYDHISCAKTKKPLSQRHHNLADGKCCIQRDIYSAFLALNAQENTHNPHQLHVSWSAVEPLLRRMGLCLEQSSSGKAPRFPTVKLPSEKIVRRSMFGTGQGINPSRD